MKNIQTETRTIKEIFSANKTDFLIPDYQRPYSWAEDKCQTLWYDFCDFAIPDGDKTAFDNDKDEYFLGVIITFHNENEQDEVIDGQQRLTTLLLLMRAFYRELGGDDGTYSKPIEHLGECIWKTVELGELDKSSLKINSEVIHEDAQAELQKILSTGTVTKAEKSRYADNYRFFQEAIQSLKKAGRLNFSRLSGTGTLNRELQRLAQTHSDFGEIDIIKRNTQMTEELISFVGKHNFLAT